MNFIQPAYIKAIKSHERSHKCFNVLVWMINLQGIDKLHHYFENSSMQMLEMILKLTLSVSILKFKKIYRSILKYRYMIPSLKVTQIS